LSRSKMHHDFICIGFADAEVISGNFYRQRVSQRSNHLYPYRLTRDAAHLHQHQLQLILFVLMYNGFFTFGQLRKLNSGQFICIHADAKISKKVYDLRKEINLHGHPLLRTQYFLFTYPKKKALTVSERADLPVSSYKKGIVELYLLR